MFQVIASLFPGPPLRSPFPVLLFYRLLFNATAFIYVQSCSNFFSQHLFMMMGKLDCCLKFSTSHPTDSQRSTVWTLWWKIHLWKWWFMVPEALCLNLTLMDPGFVILKYINAAKEEKYLLIKVHSHLVLPGCLLTSF